MKHTKSLLHAVVVAAFFMIASNANAQANKDTKKLDLKPGQKFQTDNTIKTTTSMEMMGQQMDIKADVAVIRQLEVKEKKDKAYNIVSTFTKMAANVDMMGQNVTYDSDKKEDSASEMGKLLKDQINNPISLEMNENGKITPLKKDPSTAENDTDRMADMMKNFGAGTDESNITDDVFIAIPVNVKVNDTWSDSLIKEGQNTYRQYTIKSIQDNEAVVSITGKILTNKKTENQGMEMLLVMESSLSGDMTVNMNTGVIKQRTLTTEGTGNIEMMGGQMPMSSKMEVVSVTKDL